MTGVQAKGYVPPAKGYAPPAKGLDPPAKGFRPMELSDLEEIMGIECSASANPWSKANFHDSIQAGYDCWVLTEERIKGYGITSFAENSAELLILCIDPDCQRQGLGRRLLRFLLTHAEADAAETIYLEVRASNQGAFALYCSEGFEQVGVRQNYYPLAPGSKERENALLMSLVLNSA